MKAAKNTGVIEKISVREQFTGLDIGNTESKSSKKIKIRSLIETGHNEVTETENILKVIYKGKKYTLGAGHSFSHEERYFDDSYKIMMLAILASSYKESNIVSNITIGVPILAYENRELYKRICDHLSNFDTSEIIVDGNQKSITIKNSSVWIESGVIFYNFEKYRDKKVLAIDIGGKSIDVLGFNKGKRENDFFLRDGINYLATNVLRELNREYKSDLRDGFSVLGAYAKDEDYYISDKKINMEIVDETVRFYTDGIMSEIGNMISFNEYKVVVFGGGANITRNSLSKFVKLYNIDILQEPEFVNAYTNENVCLTKFKGAKEQ